MVGGSTHGISWGGAGVASVTVYSPVLLSRRPVRMVWFLEVMLSWYAVKLNLNP